MAQISVTINGKSFRMACDDGEEDRLMGLAARFDGWINELRQAFGEIGDQRLTVMAGIMATDQLSEAERQIEQLKADLAEARAEKMSATQRNEQQERELTTAVALAAERIEKLANDLTKSLRAE